MQPISKSPVKRTAGPFARSWYEMLDALVGQGMTRADAVAQLVREEPLLHERFIAESNVGYQSR